jgi:6-phosphogluconolactonase
MTANYSSGDMHYTYRTKRFTEKSYLHGPKPETDCAGRQEGPHAHMITQAKNSFVYYTDLGLDKIFVYKLNTANSKLELTKNSITTEPGMGPRHIAFHPTQSYAYCLGELNGTIECFSVNESNGEHSRFQIISTMAPNANGSPASADIHYPMENIYMHRTVR